MDFKEKLRLSGIPISYAKKAGIEMYTEKQVKNLDIKYKREGIYIPYQHAKFFRYRYLEDPRPKLEKLVDPKPLRYVQPAGTLPEVYLPIGIDWKSVYTDKTQQLIITEGEFKAACSVIHTDIPTVGLGGVWSWKSTKNSIDLLPWFREVAWQGRPVYIVFDSDIAANPSVLAAETCLAKKLIGLGAVVKTVRFPPGDGSKIGIDDYIVAHGAQPFLELLDGSEEYAASIELHTMNSEVAYVKNPGLIYRFYNKQRISCRDFVAHQYADRKLIEMIPSTKGSYRTVEKSVPKTWLEWQSRFIVERLDYHPGKELVVQDGVLNTWPGWGCDPEESDCTLWDTLLSFLFDGAPAEDRVWFERWLAYPLQHPGSKLYTAAVMWGRLHGTGKSLVGYTMFKIYGENAVEIKERNLKETHNEWAENKQFAMGEEITGGDKRGLADTLKHMITAQQLRINPKYIPSYAVSDRINYYFTSNHCDSFFLEDDDRRFFVHEVIGAPLPDTFYKAYDNWLRSGKAGKAVFAHLLNLDLGDFNPNGRAPMTMSKEDMIVTNRSDLGDWVAMLREAPDSVLRIGTTILPYKIWRNQDLLRLYDPEGRKSVTAIGLGRELRRAGLLQAVEGRPVRTELHGQSRLWILRDMEKLAGKTGTYIGALYDKERAEAGRSTPKSLKDKKI